MLKFYFEIWFEIGEKIIGEQKKFNLKRKFPYERFLLQVIYLMTLKLEMC